MTFEAAPPRPETSISPNSSATAFVLHHVPEFLKALRVLNLFENRAERFLEGPGAFPVAAAQLVDALLRPVPRSVLGLERDRRPGLRALKEKGRTRPCAVCPGGAATLLVALGFRIENFL